MTELDEAWEVALAQATQRAHGAGRADIARYLDLRRRNDLLRRAATDWLIDAVFSLAADANRKGAAMYADAIGNLLKPLIGEAGWLPRRAPAAPQSPSPE